MSSINSEFVSKVSPELGAAANLIQLWLDRNSHVAVIEPSRLFQALKGRIAWRDLLQVFAILQSSGNVEMRYRVRFCDGTLSEEEHSSPDEFSTCVFDSSFEPVNVIGENIVPVFTFPAIVR